MISHDFIEKLPDWPAGTHQFRNLPEMLAAIAASDEARHQAEVRWVLSLESDRRRDFLLGAKGKRSPEAYARLRDDLLQAKAARKQGQPDSQSTHDVQGSLL